VSQRAGAALCVIAPHDVASFPYEAPAVRALADFAGVRRSKIHVRALPFVANPIGGDVPACVVACVREGDDGVGMLDLDGAHAALSRWGDVLVVPVSVREEGGPALIVTDVDSTLIAQEVIEELAEWAGTRQEVAAVTARAMNGEIDFAQSLRERGATLAGVPETVFRHVTRSLTVTPGAKQLIKSVHSVSGGAFGVVSGGFEEVVGPLATRLSIDFYCANRLEVRDGHLTGQVLGEIVTSHVKVRKLTEWAAQLGVSPSRCVAIGDGANDIPMMQAAGWGVAFCAKSAVRDAIPNSLAVRRLDALVAALF